MSKKNQFSRQGEGWTREEVRTLRSIFRNNATQDVAMVLQRSTKAVARKAEKLGLTKTKTYMRTLRNVA